MFVRLVCLFMCLGVLAVEQPMAVSVRRVLVGGECEVTGPRAIVKYVKGGFGFLTFMGV